MAFLKTSLNIYVFWITLLNHSVRPRRNKIYIYNFFSALFVKNSVIVKKMKSLDKIMQVFLVCVLLNLFFIFEIEVHAQTTQNPNIQNNSKFNILFLFYVS